MAESEDQTPHNDVPVHALANVTGLDLGPALDFDGVSLENGVDVASEITKCLSKSMQAIGLGKVRTLDLWWELHEDCPALIIVDMHYLAIPASSSAVERLFSQTGQIKSRLRNRMQPQTLDQLIFTRVNWEGSLYNVRPKQPMRAEGSKGGEAEEEVNGEAEEEVTIEQSHADVEARDCRCIGQ